MPARANGDDGDRSICAAAVQVELVDPGFEALVVRAQRLQHLPDVRVGAAAVKRRGGVVARRDDDGQDDVAVLLSLGAPHDPTDRLHDVDL